MRTPYVPAPGSDQAQRLGCSCPVESNHHGKVPPLVDDQWWVSGDCPLHAPWATAAAKPKRRSRKPVTENDDQHGS